jgi:tetratricopeptide (TPR) repeat protein
MTPRRAGVVLLVLLTALSSPERRAEAKRADQAREYEDRATTAFALSRYAEAAELFEKAFETWHDPALLYNAAQAHRLAGDKERALLLYQNYMRLYGQREKRVEIEARIEELQQAIEHDKAVASSPPTKIDPAPLPPASDEAPPPARDEAPAAPPPPSPRPTATPPAPALVSHPAPPDAERRPLARRPWFWMAAGGALVVVAVGAALLASGGPRDPRASLGTLEGN